MIERYVTRFLLVNTILLTLGFRQQLTAQDKPKRFLTGIEKPEDLLQLSGSHWVIASCYSPSVAESGKLMAIDPNAPGAAPLDVFPGLSILRSGNDPVNKLFRPHGINCLQTGINQYRLFVINHGGKETIEVFDVDISSGKVQVTWSKSIALPATVWANGIVVAPGKTETIFVTSMYDPSDKNFIDEFQQGEPTGQVWKWTSDQGWRTFNNKLLSGANGIEISVDGQSLYVSEWANRRLWKFSLDDAIPGSCIQLDFLPDNLRWTEKGTLLVTGQKADPATVFASHTLEREAKGNQFSVVEIDPVTLAANPLIVGGDQHFGWGTVAIAVGDEIWVGSVLTNKIACYNRR